MRAIGARTLLQAWKLCRAAKVDLFHPGVLASLATLPGWAGLRIPENPVGLGGVPLVEALRALELAARESESESSRVSLAATLPGKTVGVASTWDVARTLVGSASSELLVVGFSISDESFREHLMRRGLAGVQVMVISDRHQVGARELLRDWPSSAKPLLAFQGVESIDGRLSQVHGKIIVANRSKALVGSANFTANGFRNNLEMGLLVDGSAPRQICQAIDRLIAQHWFEALPEL